MISGIFSAEFASSLGGVGCGVAVFSENTVHGGDASHYYRGKYKLDEDRRIMSTIEVFKYSTLNNSVFGPLDKFKLTLNGIVTLDNEAFELTGQVAGQPHLMIKISLKKMDDLIEA